MPTLAEVLTAPGLNTVTPLTGPLHATEVTGVRLETRPERLVAAPPGTVVILTAPLAGHLLDVAVRDTAAAGASALVLTSGPSADSVPLAVRALAERGRVAVLRAEGDLAALVVAVDRAVAGDAADALARVADAAVRLPDTAGDPRRAAETAALALGTPVGLRAPGPHDVGVSASGPDGEVRLAAPARPGHAGAAARAVLTLAAFAAAGGGHGDTPVRSRAHLLAELLAAPQDQADLLAARGRALGLPVDGHHTILRVEAPGLPAADRYRLLEAVTSETLTRLRHDHACVGTQWHAALVDEALVLVATRPAPPAPELRRILLALARRTLDRLRVLHPDAALRGGLGVAHRGPLGLRTSAREARAALLTPAGGTPAAGAPVDGPSVVAHDAAGLDRMLLEWYASDPAREAVSELLAPVLELGTERAEPLLRALQAYLDHNNSPARAAEFLHLHRNAVTARIHRVTELTGADLTDPETRLALQLACRARLSGTGN